MRSQIKKLLPAWMLTILKHLRYLWIVFLFYLFRLAPVNPRRVVICNVWGFGDNAKYVTEELAGRKQRPQIIFITNHPQSAYAPKGVTTLKTNSVKAIKALATAKIWVDNNRKESYIRKRKNQYYIQTWHGGIALKKIEKDYGDKLGERYVANAKRDSAMADLFVSNSNFCTNLYKNSFWYQGEILECGSPRNDILLNPHRQKLEEVKARLGVKSDSKVAIYAPTYREGNNTKPYQLDFNKMSTILEEKFGGSWLFAVRLHPLVSEQSSFLKYSKRIINASYYRDIYELMAVGDLLITDYSNIMFEFSLMKKPVFLYALDEEEYTKDRGFYFDYPSLPYPKANSQEELIECVKNYQETEYQNKVDAFLNQLDIYETGTASKQVADHIFKVLNI
ncbi:MAG: CDP-glycerol:poly(glycerophosphate) glycerophosphotransferase [Anaerocolumna sp.]|jgi:CDP-glycerol glycerophosphotransferase|nr:CDP-glycerol:poly(glycerophosphate) glycerophosphotransferase [Anaerocolumna sp.]